MTKFECAQIIAASAASLTALVALLLSIYEGRSNRKHNRLSVKPMLVLNTSKSNNPTAVKAKMVNAGLGPATINKMSLFVDGVEVEGKLEQEFKATIKRLSGQLKVVRTSTSVMNPGFVLRAGEEKELVLLELHADEKCSPEELEKKFEAIDVIIDYSSLYGEADVYNSAES